MVDCCIAHDESRAQWEQIFETQLQGLPILRVIVTHMHPDHIGLADWLCAALERAAVDQRDRLPRGARAQQPGRRHAWPAATRRPTSSPRTA